MNFNEENINVEIEKTKGKLYIITILSIIIALTIFVFFEISSLKKFNHDLQQHKYYVVEINEKNQDEIKFLLDEENLEYCESMYKIEYERVFNGKVFLTLYCKGEKNKSLSIYNDESKIIHYIFENGIIEKR